MKNPRSLSIETLLHKSREELIDSDVALANGRFNNSVNRSYYSMFHAATAALKTKISDFEPTKHKGVLSSFNHHIVFNGGFNKDIAPALRELEGARMIADYEGEDFELADAQEFNKSAHEFVAEIEKFIEASKNLSKDSTVDIHKLSSSDLKTGSIDNLLQNGIVEPTIINHNDGDPEP